MPNAINVEIPREFMNQIFIKGKHRLLKRLDNKKNMNYIFT